MEFRLSQAINPPDILRLDVDQCCISSSKWNAPTTQWGVLNSNQLCIVLESCTEPLESLMIMMECTVDSPQLLTVCECELTTEVLTHTRLRCVVIIRRQLLPAVTSSSEGELVPSTSHN